MGLGACGFGGGAAPFFFTGVGAEYMMNMILHLLPTDLIAMRFGFQHTHLSLSSVQLSQGLFLVSGELVLHPVVGEGLEFVVEAFLRLGGVGAGDVEVAFDDVLGEVLSVGVLLFVGGGLGFFGCAQFPF